MRPNIVNIIDMIICVDEATNQKRASVMSNALCFVFDVLWVVLCGYPEVSAAFFECRLAT
jgi:hypothetical protein